MKILKKIIVISVFFLFFSTISAAPIDNVEKYGWGADSGWVNFNPTDGNVDVSTSAITGHIWSDNYGWINLQPTTSGVVNNCSGNLSGYAWGSNAGWVDFTNASINPTTGYFSGTLVGDNIGTIQLTGTNIGVKTDWRCSSGHSGSGGGHRSTTYTCKDSTALNFSNNGIHKQSLCEYGDDGDDDFVPVDDDNEEEIKNGGGTVVSGGGHGAKEVIKSVVFENKQCPYFNNYYRLWQRDPEITRIQLFLFTRGFLNIKNVNGIMDPATFEAIKKFQTKYASDILAPWGFKKATGRWYKTTRKKANELLGCSEPPVLLENGVWVN